MSDISKNNKAVAREIIGLLNTSGEGKSTIQPDDAMEILTSVMLGVVTVGGITGTSTNGQFTLRIEKGDTSATPVVCPECGNQVCTCTKH